GRDAPIRQRRSPSGRGLAGVRTKVRMLQASAPPSEARPAAPVHIPASPLLLVPATLLISDRILHCSPPFLFSQDDSIHALANLECGSLLPLCGGGLPPSPTERPPPSRPGGPLMPDSSPGGSKLRGPKR